MMEKVERVVQEADELRKMRLSGGRAEFGRDRVGGDGRAMVGEGDGSSAVGIDLDTRDDGQRALTDIGEFSRSSTDDEFITRCWLTAKTSSTGCRAVP